MGFFTIRALPWGGGHPKMPSVPQNPAAEGRGNGLELGFVWWFYLGRAASLSTLIPVPPLNRASLQRQPPPSGETTWGGVTAAHCQVACQICSSCSVL